MLLVPPATVSVPCEPDSVPTVTSRASHVPLETIICPMPNTPMPVELLVMVNCPPVSHTVPAAFALFATTRYDERLVPPATVNVPWELEVYPTYSPPVWNVPLDTVICPTPLSPTPVTLFVTISCPSVIQTAPVAFALKATSRNDEKMLVPPATVSVPCEPARKPTHTTSACQV